MKLKFLYNPACSAWPVKYKLHITIKLIVILVLISASRLFAHSYPVKEHSKDTDVKNPAIEVKGKVIDDKTQAEMPGVNIYLKTNKKVAIAITNEKGEFKVNVQPDDVIVFAFVGYKPKEVKVSNTKPLTVKMEPVVNSMNDVVITGYQTLKKDTYTGSAVVISGDDLKRNNPTNVIKAIASFDPSVRMGDNNLTGSNPNSLPKITVRGSTSLPSVDGSIIDRNNLSSTYNLPLFILDGFETTEERVVDLDIDRIASITILKDAAATAVYGSSASNGVIVITTKAPKAGKLQLTFNTDFTISAPDLSSYHVLNAAQKLQYEKLAGLYNAGLNPLANQDNLDADYSARLENVVSGVNTYWLSQPLKNAYGLRQYLNAEGGDSTFRYDIYGSYQTSPGVMIGSSRNNYSGGMTFNYTPTKNLLFRNDLQVAQENSTDSPYGSFASYVAMNPYYPLTDANGKSLRELANYQIDTQADGNAQYRQENVLNPLYEAQVGNFSKSAYLELTDNLSVDWHLSPSLRLQGQIALTDHKAKSDEFVSPLSDQFYYGPANLIQNRGSYTYIDNDVIQYDGRVQLGYNKQFGYHSINVALSGEVQDNTSDSKAFEAVGFSNATFTNIGFARSYLLNAAPGGDVATARKVSDLLIVDYAFKDKYLFDGTFNYSGSSVFGDNKKFVPVWSTGIGWNVHKEDFMKNNFPAISRLKLTATTGLTGSVNFSPDQAKTIYTYQTANWYSTGVGATVNGYGNSDLQWLRTHSYELQLDLGLFNDRLLINPHYYYKLSQGEIIPVPLPPSTGYTSYTANLGDMKNTGEEVYFTWNAYRTASWNINLTGNFSHQTNIVTHIADALKAYNESVNAYQTNPANNAQTTPLLQYAEGQSIQTIYGVKSEGIDPETGKEIFVKKNGTLTFVYDVKDQQPIGNMEPKGTGNLGANISYKQFYFGFNFSYQFGGDYYNQTLVDRVEDADPRYNVDSRALADRWQKPGDVTLYKNIADLSVTLPTSRFVQKLNEFSLQSVNFTYTVNPKIAKKMGMRSLRLSLTSNDLFTVSSIQQERGIDYPYARSLTGSLQANF